MGAKKPFSYSEREILIAAGARALLHPCRIRIIRLIHEHKEVTSNDLRRYFKLSASTIREHIMKLRDAQFIHIEYCPHYYILTLNHEQYALFRSLISHCIQNDTADTLPETITFVQQQCIWTDIPQKKQSKP